MSIRSTVDIDFENEIPANWVEVPLTDLALLNPGLDRCFIDETAEITFVPMAAVDEDFGGIQRPETRSYHQAKKGYTPFIPGDVIFAKITPCMENGKGGIAPKNESVYFGSTEFHVFRPCDKADARWIAHFLSQVSFRRSARLKMKGSAGQLRVPKTFLETVELPLPPKTEQKRILDRLDELFTELDAGVAALERVRKKLPRYRAALLHAAVTGRLTEDFRKQHPQPQEDGQALLQRILKARREDWETRTRKKYEDAKRQPPKGWKTRYKDPPDTTPSFGDDPLWELSESWLWTTLGRCFSVQVGATPSRSISKYWGGNIPWVSSGEVKFCDITSTRETITEDGLANSSAKLNPPGSVLLGMIGEGKTRGQPAILRVEAAHNQNAAAILVSRSPVLPEWVFFWLCSQYDSTRRRGSGGNQPALNKTRVESIPFPLIPLEEQSEVVSKLKENLSLIDAMAEEIERGLRRAARLRQAILKAAFEGKLVPQDPDDEPAAVLLERLRQERAAQTTRRNKKTPRKKTPRKKTPKKKAARKAAATLTADAQRPAKRRTLKKKK